MFYKKCLGIKNINHVELYVFRKQRIELMHWNAYFFSLSLQKCHEEIIHVRIVNTYFVEKHVQDSKDTTDAKDLRRPSLLRK